MLDPTAVLRSTCTLTDCLDAAEHSVKCAMPEALTDRHVTRILRLVESIRHKRGLSERGKAGYVGMKAKQ